jgi:hypothetical protein
VVYSVLLPQGPRALAILSPEGVLGVIAFVTFFAALFTARLYARFAAEGMEGGLVKTVVFLAVTGVYLIAIILLAAYNKIPAAWAKREMRMLVALLPAAFTVSGIKYGLNEEHYGGIRYTLYIPLVMLFILTPILLLDAFGNGPAPLALGLVAEYSCFLSLPFSSGAPFTLATGGSGCARHPRAGRMVLLPLVTSLALVLWQELTCWDGQGGGQQQDGAVGHGCAPLLLFRRDHPAALLAAFTRGPLAQPRGRGRGHGPVCHGNLDLTRALQGG